MPRHFKSRRVWTLSLGSSYGRWVANCLLSQANRLCARRISRPSVDLTPRHSFLDLVAYTEIAPQACRKKCARCRRGGWRSLPGCYQFMGSPASALQAALATTASVSRLVDARDGIESSDGSAPRPRRRNCGRWSAGAISRRSRRSTHSGYGPYARYTAGDT